MELSPYLNFNGNCNEAFKFYEKALGGRIEVRSEPERGTTIEFHFQRPVPNHSAKVDIGSSRATEPSGRAATVQGSDGPRREPRPG